MAGNKSAPLLPAYLAVGADELKRNTAMSRLKAKLDPGLEAFNLDDRTASADMVPNDVIASLNTMPMGTDFRLVILRKADKLPKPVSEAVITYLANPNPGCVLFLDADTLPKGTRLYKAVKKVGDKAVIDCTPQKRWKLPDYVVKHCISATGMPIDRDAADELVNRVGESTILLDRQVRSLAEFCRKQGRITLRDVEEHTARVAEVKPWEFLDAVCARDAGRAMSLYNLMDNPSQIALLSLVVMRLRELICAKALEERGEGALLASTLKKQDWQVKNHRAWARRFSVAELNHCLAACARCDRGLKSGADPDLEFTQLILRICRG